MHHVWVGGIWVAWPGRQGHARALHAHMSRATTSQNTSGLSVTFESPSGWQEQHEPGIEVLCRPVESQQALYSGHWLHGAQTDVQAPSPAQESRPVLEWWGTEHSGEWHCDSADPWVGAAIPKWGQTSA